MESPGSLGYSYRVKLPTAGNCYNVSVGFPNDIMHKRWSLNDPKQSLLQHEWKNSSQSKHLEGIKSGSEMTMRTSRPDSIVSQRKAFFESHLKLPVPVTKNPTKHGKIPAALMLCSSDPAKSSIVGRGQRPCQFSNDGDDANIIDAKLGKEGPIQKYFAIEKGRQLIGLYQAICETVKQSSYDSQQTISVPHKEKPSQTLQDRLQRLLNEESDHQEEQEEKILQRSFPQTNKRCIQMSAFGDENPDKYLQRSRQIVYEEESGHIPKSPYQNVTSAKLRSKKQCFVEGDKYRNDPAKESQRTCDLPPQALDKYHNMGLIEAKSAFIQRTTFCVPRAGRTSISCQKNFLPDKLRVKSVLDSDPNNGIPPSPETRNSSGEQESESPHLGSVIDASSSDSVSTGTTRLSQLEDIRQHLQSLEENYQELVTLLSRESGTVPVRRKLLHWQKRQSPVKNGKLLAQLSSQRQKDLCTVQRRFAHLEAHILLLTRNIARLADEVGSQMSLLQKIHSLQQEVQKTQHVHNKAVGLSDKLSIRQNSSELSQCCGGRPSMMTIFLKKLGCEKYVPHFENAAMGVMELPYLNEERLVQLGIPLGPRLRILHEVTNATFV
ncbi:uncharacterized protein LOC119957921 isoform X3 [Scyliorhinus canicula]|uniref:uncharacterized protein LOC119957921 isoform X3 n=1 Tax=Scyliorhinus canicula TaxID=7830 RepID=UPI0018F6AD9B|nr:uncharacterized protein LOC119957921 isoform X3 [Scyliorhinus canicula]